MATRKTIRLAVPITTTRGTPERGEPPRDPEVGPTRLEQRLAALNSETTVVVPKRLRRRVGSWRPTDMPVGTTAMVDFTSAVQPGAKGMPQPGGPVRHKAQPTGPMAWDSVIQAWVRRPSPPAPTQADQPPEQRGPVPCTVYIRKDEAGWWVVSCRYHAAFIWDLKRDLPGGPENREWIPETKSWRFAPAHAPILMALLSKHFRNVVLVRRPGEQQGQAVQVKGSSSARGTAFDEPRPTTRSAMPKAGGLFGAGRAVETASAREEKQKEANQKINEGEIPPELRGKVVVVEEP